MAVDRESARAAVRAFLRALGHDPADHPELADTPARVTDAFADELLAGYEVDLGDLIVSGSEPVPEGPERPGLVMLRDLAVASVCPHHLTTSLGRAAVCYLPGRLLLGLGTVAKLVDALSRRLTFQEAIGTRVVEALMGHGQARGAFCMLALTHGCLCARGARQPGAIVLTSAAAGVLADPGSLGALSQLLGHDPRQP
jgi:GTP cyclohydrolase IA